MDTGIPPYLAQQGAMGPQNDFMGGPFASGYYNSAMGYMAGANMYGPTYGQFGYDSFSMMGTPYGGMMSPGHTAPFYGSMLNHPVRSFFTYTLPVYKAPKGINPVLYHNYIDETRQEAISSFGMGAVTFATGLAGGKIGGAMGGGAGAVVGTIGGTLLGMVASKYVGAQTSRILQIHETSNLLNLAKGSNEYGVGITMKQASSLNMMFAKAASKDANITQEEYQQIFSGLAHNALVDDSGDFSGVKNSLKKMKKIVVNLQDLFQNGDIKNIIEALRQFKMLDLNTAELSQFSQSAAMAATIMGQKPRDFINNAIGQAVNLSETTGLSAASLVKINISNVAGMGSITKATKKYNSKGTSSKNLLEKWTDVSTKALQEQNNPQIEKLFFARGSFTQQQYMLAGAAAGLLEYNKAHHTHYTLAEAEKQPELMKTVFNKYGVDALRKMLDKHHGDASAVYSELESKDKTYARMVFDPQATKDALKDLHNPMEYLNEWAKHIDQHPYLKKILGQIAPGATKNIREVMEIVKDNPDLYWNIMQKDKAMKLRTQRELKANQHRRNDSIQGFIQTTKAHVINRFASKTADELVAENTEKFTSNGVSNDEFSAMADLYRKIGKDKKEPTDGKYDFITVTNGSDIFGSSHMYSNVVRHLFTSLGKNLKDDAELLNATLGQDKHYTEKDIKELWRYKRAAVYSLANYSRTVDNYIKTGDDTYLQRLRHLTSMDFESKNSDDIPTDIFDGELYMQMDKKTKENNDVLISKKLKRLEIYRTALKTAKTKKDKDFLMQKINKTATEIKILHKSSRVGMADLMKSLGFKTDKDSLIKARDEMRDALKAGEGDDIANSVAKMEGVGKDVAMQQIKNLAGLTDKAMGAIATITNPISIDSLNKFTKNTKWTKVAATTGDALTNLYRMTDGNLGKIDTILNNYAKAVKDGNADDFVGILKQSGNATKEQIAAAKKYHDTLGKVFKEIFGDKGFTYKGKTYTDVDTLFQNKDALNAFLKHTASSVQAVGLLKRVGINADLMTGGAVKQMMSTLVDKKKGLFTIKDGKFVFSDYAKNHLDELTSDSNVKKLLNDAGLSDTKSGLELLKKELNGQRVHQLDKTNELLKQILEVIKVNKKGTNKSGLGM